MSQKPKSWQEKYLSGLKSYDGLYFYCEANMPPSMRKSKLHDGWSPVGYPGNHIPVIPLGNDWRRARRLCDMLCWVLRVHVPHALEISPVIASAKELTGYGSPFYIWTELVTLDAVCGICGSIERVPHTWAEEGGGWLCGDCLDSLRWHDAYKETA